MSNNKPITHFQAQFNKQSSKSISEPKMQVVCHFKMSINGYIVLETPRRTQQSVANYNNNLVLRKAKWQWAPNKQSEVIKQIKQKANKANKQEPKNVHAVSCKAHANKTQKKQSTISTNNNQSQRNLMNQQKIFPSKEKSNHNFNDRELHQKIDKIKISVQPK